MYNQYIKIDNKMISEKCHLTFNHLPYIKMLEILDDTYSYLSQDNINNVMRTNINILQYNSLKTAIPKVWKATLKNHDIVDIDVLIVESHEPIIKIGSQYKIISKIINKHIKNKLLDKKIKPPTSINTWIDIFPFLEKQDGIVYM